MAVKPNAATQAIRQQREVAKAAGVKYAAPASKAERAAQIPVNKQTQATRVQKATASAPAKMDNMPKVRVSADKDVRPAQAGGNPDSGTVTLSNGRMIRSANASAGLTSQAKKMRKAAGVNERIQNRRLAIRNEARRKANAVTGAG